MQLKIIKKRVQRVKELSEHGIKIHLYTLPYFMERIKKINLKWKIFFQFTKVTFSKSQMLTSK